MPTNKALFPFAIRDETCYVPAYYEDQNNGLDVQMCWVEAPSPSELTLTGALYVTLCHYRSTTLTFESPLK